MRLIRTLALSACLLTTACMASGTQVKESQLGQFHKGKSSIEDVQTALGDPNTTTLMPDGSRMLCYNYFEMATRPETFIPIVGGLVGGADSRMNMTCFTFDPDGILKTYTATSSQNGAGSNLASGVHSGRVPNEPRQAR